MNNPLNTGLTIVDTVSEVCYNECVVKVNL